MKKVLFFLFAALSFAACKPQGEEPEKPVNPGDSSVKVLTKDISLSQGGTAFIRFETNPKGADVIFSSSDESVATVSEAGIVTAESVGNAVITVALKGKPEIKDEVNVTVIGVVDELANKVFNGGVAWNGYLEEREIGNTIWLKDGKPVVLKSATSDETFSVDSISLCYVYLFTEDQAIQVSGNSMSFTGNGLMLHLPTAIARGKSSKDGVYYTFPFFEYEISDPENVYVDLNDNGENKLSYDKVPGVYSVANSKNFNLYEYRTLYTKLLSKDESYKDHMNYSDKREATVVYWGHDEKGEIAVNVQGLVKGDGFFSLDWKSQNAPDYKVNYMDITVDLFQGDPYDLGFSVYENPEDGKMYFEQDEEGLLVVKTKEVKYAFGERPSEEVRSHRGLTPVRVDAFEKMQQVNNLSNVAMSNLMKDFSALRMNR